jgi:serine/threonine protein kinase
MRWVARGVALLGLVALHARAGDASPKQHLGTIAAVHTAESDHGPARDALFQLERHIGSGGYTHVFEAREVGSPRRLVAVKVLRNGYLREGGEDTFDYETGILRLLAHRALPEPIGVGGTTSGRRAMVMGLAPGRPLGSHHQPMPPLQVGDAALIATQVLDAVEAFEEAGYYHNDIQPGNVTWDPETRQAMLLDVGNARRKNEPQPGSAAFYRQPRHGSANRDVYSTAALLLHMVTGQPSLKAIPAVADGGLRAILERALDPDPERQFRDARALKAALAPYLPR